MREAPGADYTASREAVSAALHDPPVTAMEAKQRLADLNDEMRALIEKWRNHTTYGGETEYVASYAHGMDNGYSGAADDLEAILDGN